MSLTQWLTRHCPTVSCRPVAKASLSFVPTPSALDTSTGSRVSSGTRYSPPNAPSSDRVKRSRVEATSAFRLSLARSAASRSTPASR